MRVDVGLLLFGVVAAAIGVISCDEDLGPQEYEENQAPPVASSIKTKTTETVIIKILYKLKDQLSQWRDECGHQRTQHKRILEYQLQILIKILKKREESKHVTDRAFFSSYGDDLFSSLDTFCDNMYDILHYDKFPYVDKYFDSMWPLVRNLRKMIPDTDNTVGSLSGGQQNNDDYDYNNDNDQDNNDYYD